MSAYTGSPASEPPADGDAGIAISVVIPTYRRFELLSRCLTAIAVQDFPAEHFEIIVADDDAPSARSNLYANGSSANLHIRPAGQACAMCR